MTSNRMEMVPNEQNRSPSHAIEDDNATCPSGRTTDNGVGAQALPIEQDIMQLARLGEVGAIQRLFDEGNTDAMYKDEQGISPLHWAAIKNHYALCHFLIQAGADINAKGGDVAGTPILWAARSCNYYVVNLLLQEGADPLLTDDQGFNLLQNATMDGNVFQILLLLYHDIAVDVPDAKGHTSLMWAAYKGYPPVVEILLKWGASVAAKDEGGFTALHWSLVKGSYECIQKLIEYGSDRSVKTSDGKSPAICAREMNSTSQWHLALAECGFNPNGSSKNFPLSSVIKDRYLFIWRFFFLWPFLILLCCFAVLSYLPVFVGLPSAMVLFFLMQYGSQRLLKWGPPNIRHIHHTVCYFVTGFYKSLC